MKIRFGLFLTFILFSACGGSGSPSSAIEGVWKGDLYQGVISCSDGTFIAAGGGSVISTVKLEVTGTDEIGSVVEARDGDCLFQGIREIDGFRAEVVSGCEQGLDHLQFTVISKDHAGLSFHSDINKVPAGANGVRCTITPSGIIER